MQSKIIKITKLRKKERITRYNLEVEESNNYFANNILVHNCRCIATKHGLFTRKGERYLSVPHIEKALEKFFKAFPDAVLDGELYNYEKRQKLNELISLVRKTKNISKEDLKNSENIVEYVLYDGYNIGGQDHTQPYSIRLAYLQMIPKSAYVQEHFIKVTSWEKLRSQEHFERLYNELIEDGQEGAILRKVDMPYEHKRSKNLLKVKPEEDDECEIIDIKSGQGNWNECGKIISVKWNNREFDITFKGTMEDSKQFLIDKDKWIGKTVTFNYFGLTGLGIPQYGQLNFANCIKS